MTGALFVGSFNGMLLVRVCSILKAASMMKLTLCTVSQWAAIAAMRVTHLRSPVNLPTASRPIQRLPWIPLSLCQFALWVWPHPVAVSKDKQRSLAAEM